MRFFETFLILIDRHVDHSLRKGIKTVLNDQEVIVSIIQALEAAQNQNPQLFPDLRLGQEYAYWDFLCDFFTGEGLR